MLPNGKKKKKFSELQLSIWLRPVSSCTYSEFMYSDRWDEQRENWRNCGEFDPQCP